MNESHFSVVQKLFIPLLIADVLIGIFYFTRISNLVQDVWSGAYNIIVFDIEAHILVGVLFSVILLLVPLLFYGHNLKLENLYFKHVSLNSGLLTIFLIIGNIMVFFSEILVTYIQFDVSRKNPLSGQVSPLGETATWGMALLLPIFHQISSNYTIVSMNMNLEKLRYRR